MTSDSHAQEAPAGGARGRAIATFALCFLASLVEGFDIQSAGVVAPKFAPVFELTPAQLGWVFSSNTFGLFLGAALGGSVSDRFGRRTVLITSMLVFGIFSLGTALAPTTETLIAMRFLTGLGLGGAMPNLIALTAETGASSNRALKVTLITAGIPLGGSLASLLAWVGGPALEWQAIFWVGGAAPLVVGVLMLFLLPESQAFTKARLEPTRRMSTTTALFGGGRAIRTLALWIGFLLTLIVLYLILNWLPSLLISKGFAQSDATLGTLLFAFGGAVGAVALGLAMSRLGWKVIVTASYAGMALTLFLMANVERDTPTMLAIAFGIGFFVIGAQYLLYGLSPVIYPSSVRGTGVGWGVAVGRLGAIAGPAMAAAILAAGLTATDVLLAMQPVIGGAFLAVLILTWRKFPEVD
jgi:MFS transporter, AAHS family, 3-hydroxyphenylpropionic acid transporter